MPKIQIRQQIRNSYFATYCHNSTQTTNLKPNQALFDKNNQL